MSEPKISRYFTLKEVNQCIPMLETLFIDVMQLRVQIKSLYQQLNSIGYPPPKDEKFKKSTQVPPDVLQYQAQFYALIESLREHVIKIQKTGCIIKDIETGLVDWPSKEQGRCILLCWKMGEKEVSRWHEINDGFSGRKSVGELADQLTEEIIDNS